MKGSDHGDYPQIAALIGHEWRELPGLRPIINPATEEVLGQLPQAGPADLNDAAAAATAGFDEWRRTAPAERCRIMLAAANLLHERREQIARVMTREQGKPLDQSLVEVERACAIIEWDANEGLRTYGRIIPAAPGMTHMVLRQPLGPVAAFSPWNFPASSPARKIGGALAAGCSIILKPAEETPGTAVLMAQAFLDAGLPPGVLNLVFGDPAVISDHLIRHPDIRLVTFTGSVPVGKQLAALAGSLAKPAIMELGGHAPVIVCADADIPRTARQAVMAKSRNAGQVCVAPTRFYVDETVHDEFLARMAAAAQEMTLGNGLDSETRMGPLANPRRLAAIDEMVTDALSGGARLVTGGTRGTGPGFFYPLTILADVPTDARCLHEEPFGPLAIVARVPDLDTAIVRANALPYALAAYAATDSAHIIERLANEVECGNLAINHMTASFPETPFGGIKDSGFGREGGNEGLGGYTYAKLVSVATNPPG